MDPRGDEIKIRRIGRHNMRRRVDHTDKYSTMYHRIFIPDVLLVMLIILGIYCSCYTSRIMKEGTQHQMPTVEHVAGTSGFV